MRTPVAPVVRACLDALIASLAAQFDGTFSVDTIERYVEDTYDAMAERAHVHTFLPVFIERVCRERLTALALVREPARDHRPQVLFVCTHNAGRSQMAAALLDAFSGAAVGVWSAGTHPIEEIDPVVLDVLDEVGIELPEAFPKPVTPQPLHDS
jgi:arsenate reductase (thioredoxin)